MLKLSDSTIDIRINRIKVFPAFIIVFFVNSVLGFTEFLVGTELTFSLFYLLPITLAILLSGRKLGIVFSFICTITWLLAEILSGLNYSSILFPIFNSLIRLCYFFIHTTIFSNLLETLNHIKAESFTDPLTKAANWRYFKEYSNQIIGKSMREKEKITIVFIDLDNFKEINDTYGHSIGDEVLITITQLIQNEIRPQDLLARLGGDEFSIILTNTNTESTRQILKRIESSVKNEMEINKWNVSLSIGAMVFSKLSSSIESMLKSVDEIMYEVKNNGKNNMKIVEQIV